MEIDILAKITAKTLPKIGRIFMWVYSTNSFIEKNRKKNNQKSGRTPCLVFDQFCLISAICFCCLSPPASRSREEEKKKRKKKKKKKFKF
jgi:hypothetical protein